MGNITVLDQSTIDKIAAGEVIERPASVVKELLENAVDAGATAVTVEIKDGGTTFMRVTDNGGGIPKEEVPLAFLRHSTSKIRSADDLFAVSSLGFRGEALSSIAAVSQVELITRTSGALTGTRYQIEGGREMSLEEIGAPEGTTFIARNLFFNTPVRKKFLKTPATEAAHVADLVEKIALSHPEISVRYIQNNQNKLHTSGNHNLKDMVYTVFGREVAGNLLQVSARGDAVTLEGYIGKPVVARGNRNYENYFVNGRYVKSGIVAKAIEEAYRPYMMQHKYPFTLLHFTIEPELLDVNVHPTKMELRFQDGEAIYRLVAQALQSALSHKELIPKMELGGSEAGGGRFGLLGSPDRKKGVGAGREGREERIPEPFEKNRMERLREEPQPVRAAGFYETGGVKPSAVREEPQDWIGPRLTRLAPFRPESGEAGAGGQVPAEGGDGRTGTEERPSEAVMRSEKPASAEGMMRSDKPAGAEQLDLFEERLLEPEARKRHRLIGQLFDTYWLVEFNDQLYIIDQHAAHEKVLYEKTMASLKRREFTSQIVAPPIILTLSMNESLLFEQHKSRFEEMGFEIEHFGGKEYAVRAVPDNLFSIAEKDLLMEMIDCLSSDGTPDNPDILYDRVAAISCKAAVKGNHRMSEQEADRLIDLLLELENPYACPHGRPTILSMSRHELEKKFKRIV